MRGSGCRGRMKKMNSIDWYKINAAGVSERQKKLKGPENICRNIG